MPCPTTTAFGAPPTSDALPDATARGLDELRETDATTEPPTEVDPARWAHRRIQLSVEHDVPLGPMTVDLWVGDPRSTRPAIRAMRRR